MRPALTEIEMALTQSRDAAGRKARHRVHRLFRVRWRRRLILPVLGGSSKLPLRSGLTMTFDDEVTDPLQAEASISP